MSNGPRPERNPRADRAHAHRHGRDRRGARLQGGRQDAREGQHRRQARPAEGAHHRNHAGRRRGQAGRQARRRRRPGEPARPRRRLAGGRVHRRHAGAVDSDRGREGRADGRSGQGAGQGDRPGSARAGQGGRSGGGPERQGDRAGEGLRACRGAARQRQGEGRGLNRGGGGPGQPGAYARRSMSNGAHTGTVELEERRQRREASRPSADGSMSAVLKRTVKGFSKDNLTDWAAALTYYGVLAIFPALIVLVSVLGLVGESATQPLIDNLGKVAPGPAKDIFTSALKNLQGSQGTAGVLFVVGLAGALWSASGYVAAFMRASNQIYDMPEGRPIWKTLPLRVALTLVLVILLAITAVGVTLTGGLAKEVGGVIGLSDTAVSVWNIAKWPVLVVIVSFMFALLYWAAPNVRHPKFRWVSPGGVVGVLLWIVASAAFAFYVANFSSYNKTYGAMAGVIVFLVWLWISNIAVLLGAEFNAELERGRQMEAGHVDSDEEPFLEPRDTR